MVAECHLSKEKTDVKYSADTIFCTITDCNDASLDHPLHEFFQPISPRMRLSLGTSYVSVMPGWVLTSRHATPLDARLAVVITEVRTRHATTSQCVVSLQPGAVPRTAR